MLQQPLNFGLNVERLFQSPRETIGNHRSTNWRNPILNLVKALVAECRLDRQLHGQDLYKFRLRTPSNRSEITSTARLTPSSLRSLAPAAAACWR